MENYLDVYLMVEGRENFIILDCNGCKNGNKMKVL